MNKEISDVLEYLYKQGKKDMALAVIKAIQVPPNVVVQYPTYQPIQYEPLKFNQPYWTSGLSDGTVGRQA